MIHLHFNDEPLTGITGEHGAKCGYAAARRAEWVSSAAGEMDSWSEAALKPIFGVEPSYIETSLDLIEEAGGIEAFLTEKVGVPAATVQRLREDLLE